MTEKGRRPFTDRVNIDSRILQELTNLTTATNLNKKSQISFSKIPLSKFKIEKSNSCVKAMRLEANGLIDNSQRKRTEAKLSSKEQGMNLGKLRKILEDQKTVKNSVSTKVTREFSRESNKENKSKTHLHEVSELRGSCSKGKNLYSNEKITREESRSSPAQKGAYLTIEPPIFSPQPIQCYFPPRRAQTKNSPSATSRGRDDSIKRFPCSYDDLSPDRQDSISPRLSKERNQLISKIKSTYRNLLSTRFPDHIDSNKLENDNKWDFKDMKMYSYNSYVKLYGNIPHPLGSLPHSKIKL